MTTTIEAPCYVTTIDQDQGVHTPTGLTERKLVDVRTSYGDRGDKAWENLSAEDRAWWAEVLSDLHAAEVALAELPADHRARAKEALLNESVDRVEDEAAMIREAIADTTEA